MDMEVDGYHICCKTTGSGEKTAAILQGWGTDLSIYDSVADVIAEEYTVIRLDLPGFGGSDEPREAWDVDAYADFFCRFLEALHIKKLALIGHSYGGRVIIKLAARQTLPFAITRIVLIDSAGIMPKRSAASRLKVKSYKFLRRLFDIRLVYALFPELIDDWRSRQGSADYRNASPIMRQCLVKAVNEDLTELLVKITQDTLLIWGDMDTATPLSDAKLMEEKIPNAGLAVLHGAGHFSFLEQPAAFRNIMRAYFQTGAKR